MMAGQTQGGTAIKAVGRQSRHRLLSDLASRQLALYGGVFSLRQVGNGEGTVELVTCPALQEEACF
jgi:hypothetical protein